MHLKINRGIELVLSHSARCAIYMSRVSCKIYGPFFARFYTAQPTRSGSKPKKKSWNDLFSLLYSHLMKVKLIINQYYTRFSWSFNFFFDNISLLFNVEGGGMRLDHQKGDKRHEAEISHRLLCKTRMHLRMRRENWFKFDLSSYTTVTSAFCNLWEELWLYSAHFGMWYMVITELWDEGVVGKESFGCGSFPEGWSPQF